MKESSLKSDPSFLGEVEELLVNLVLRECFKPVKELLSVLGDAGQLLVQKIELLVHDLYGFYLQ